MANEFKIKGLNILHDAVIYEMDYAVRNSNGDILVVPYYGATSTAYISGVAHTVRQANVMIIVDYKNTAQEDTPYTNYTMKRYNTSDSNGTDEIDNNNGTYKIFYSSINALYVEVNSEGEIIYPLTMDDLSNGSNVIFLNDKNNDTLTSAFSAARNYFDEHYDPTRPPGISSGSIPLTILKAGQQLRVYSQKYKKTFTYYVENNEEDINLKVPDWEIAWAWNYGGRTGVMLVDSNYNAVCTTDDWSEDLVGSLFKYKGETNALIAKRKVFITRGDVDNKPGGAVKMKKGKKTHILGMQIVIAKKSKDIKLPFETAIHWQVGSSMSGCIISENEESFWNWNSCLSGGGEYLTLGYYGYNHKAAFAAQYADGYSKYYNYNTSNKQKFWGDKVATDTSATNGQCFIAFAIPE